MSTPTNLGTQTAPSIFRRFRVYLKDFKFAFFIAVIGMIGYSAIDVAVVAQLKPIVDDSLGKGDYQYLRLASYFIVPIFVLRGILNFLGTYTVAWIGNHVVMRLRQQLFSRYIYLPVEFHDNNSTGQLISKVIYDTEQVANASSKALITLVREGALVIGLLVAMFLKSWQLSLIFILIGPLVAVIVSVVSKRFRLVSKRIQDAMGGLTSSVEQVLKGHKVVLMFGGQDIEDTSFADKNNHNRQQNMKLQATSAISNPVIQLITSFAIAAVLLLASMDQILNKLTPGSFTLVLIAMGSLLKPLKQLSNINQQLQKGLTAAQR